jgi:hypothetical protein
MPGRKRRAGHPDKVVHLYSQADRARRMAVECGSALVADLFEIHAQMCERNAKMRRPRRKALRLRKKPQSPEFSS